MAFEGLGVVERVVVVWVGGWMVFFKGGGEGGGRGGPGGRKGGERTRGGAGRRGGGLAHGEGRMRGSSALAHAPCRTSALPPAHQRLVSPLWPLQTVPSCPPLYKNSFTYHTVSASPPPLDECYAFLGAAPCTSASCAVLARNGSAGRRRASQRARRRVAPSTCSACSVGAARHTM